MKFLYAAYFAAWTIHVLYICYLTGRFRRVREDMKELQNQ